MIVGCKSQSSIYNGILQNVTGCRKTSQLFWHILHLTYHDWIYILLYTRFSEWWYVLLNLRKLWHTCILKGLSFEKKLALHHSHKPCRRRGVSVHVTGNRIREQGKIFRRVRFLCLRWCQHREKRTVFHVNILQTLITWCVGGISLAPS